MLQFHRNFTYGGFKKSVCLLCVYLCDSFCAIQTACRQSRAFPVQTGSAVTVPSVETKPQGNTMEPPAVTAVKASSDAPYARAMCTPAGTDSEKRVCVWHTEIHINMLLCTFLIMCRYLTELLSYWSVKLRYVTLHFVIRFWSVKLLVSLNVHFVQVQQAVHCG